MITVSSKEPQVIKKLLGEYEQSDWPEDLGLDFGWICPDGKIAGIQRKKFPEDFISSMNDGRLDKEVLQMSDVDWKILVLEGIPRWSTDGTLIEKYNGGITVKFLTSMLFSYDFIHNIRHHWTSSQVETVNFVKLFHAWSTKEKHTGALGTERPPSNVDWRDWILRHFPNIGPETSKSILEFNPEPLIWWNNGEDLEKVKGVGRKTAEKLRRALKKPCK